MNLFAIYASVTSQLFLERLETVILHSMLSIHDADYHFIIFLHFAIKIKKKYMIFQKAQRAVCGSRPAAVWPPLVYI